MNIEQITYTVFQDLEFDLADKMSVASNEEFTVINLLELPRLATEIYGRTCQQLKTAPA